MKLLAEKRGSKYFIIFMGLEYEVEFPEVKKTTKKKSSKKSK